MVIVRIVGFSIGAALLTALVERVALVIAGEGWSLDGEGDKRAPRAQRPALVRDLGHTLHGSTKLVMAVTIGLLVHERIELISVVLGTVLTHTAIEVALRSPGRRATDVTLTVLRQWLFALQTLFAFFVLRS
jgi:hypothetical protein